MVEEHRPADRAGTRRNKTLAVVVDERGGVEGDLILAEGVARRRGVEVADKGVEVLSKRGECVSDKKN